MTSRFLAPVLAGFFIAAGTAPALSGAQDTAGGDAAEAPRVLIFSHTTGFRHDSIETGVAALSALGEDAGYEMIATEDPAVFSADGLRGVDAIIFLSSTTGQDGEEWFVGERRTALQDFVHGGGGIVGIHGAIDSHYNWPWYGRMMGGYFQSHPPGTPTGTLSLTGNRHASVTGLEGEFSRTDEWYWIEDFDPTVNLLVTLDPESIGHEDVNPKPISWAHEFEGGRVFYTAMGHTRESFAEPAFLDHVAGGIAWTLDDTTLGDSAP